MYTSLLSETRMEKRNTRCHDKTTLEQLRVILLANEQKVLVLGS